MTVDSWDAIDCLYAFGYTIKKATNPMAVGGCEYQLGLWGKAVTSKEQKSIDLLLKEMSENKGYYSERITEIGRNLL